MEGHCSTGQSPQWAVVPMEEEEAGQALISKECYKHWRRERHKERHWNLIN